MTLYRDHLLRYDVDRARFPATLAERIVGLELDDAARAFIDAAIEHPHARVLGLVHRVLRPILSDFDINGLLGTHPLHLLSTDQWRRLLGARRRPSLLDVGAGSGDVTKTLAPLFEHVTTTETSWAMARRLRRRGFECLRLDAAAEALPETSFEVISCLNVLDRCDRPRSLLARLVDRLPGRGQLVIATPLPIHAFVYDGGSTRDPLERLACTAAEWEAAASELARNELEPLDLEILALARAPYLSRGFTDRALYVLDDALFVCARSW